MPLQVKICGVKTPAAVAAACAGGAGFLGFNFCADSPRFVTPPYAAELAATMPEQVKKVALVVDAGDDALGQLLQFFPATLLQLHGQETPARVAAIKQRFCLPVIKACAIAAATDLAAAMPYAAVADMLLFDAKPPPGSPLTGGHARSFDWNILHGLALNQPWFLAGGLHVGNIAQAAMQSGARMLDVASGVERVRGEKDVDLIHALLDKAKTL